MRKYIKSRSAEDNGEELDQLLELTSSDTVNVTLPDISYLPKRKDAIHLKPEDEILLQRRTIATLQLGEEAQVELGQNIHSVFGTLEHGYSIKNLYFTINDLGLSHYEVRFHAEEYWEIFDRLACDPIDLKLIGEIDGGVFCIKGFEPASEDTFAEFYDEIP